MRAFLIRKLGAKLFPCGGVSLIVALFSSSASGSVCQGTEDLQSHVSLCQQNEVFAKAASRCLGRISQDVAAQQALITQALQQSKQSSGADSQSGKVAQQLANLESMRNSLQLLIDEASAARAEFMNYGQSFKWPGGYSAETVARLNLAGLFFNYPCFSDNMSSVLDSTSALDKKIADLSNALMAAGAQKAQNSTALGQLANASASTSPPAITGQNGRMLRAAVSGGKSADSESAVTGNLDETSLAGGQGRKPSSSVSPVARAPKPSGISKDPGVISSFSGELSETASVTPAPTGANSPVPASAGESIWSNQIDTSNKSQNSELVLAAAGADAPKDSAPLRGPASTSGNPPSSSANDSDRKGADARGLGLITDSGQGVVRTASADAATQSKLDSNAEAIAAVSLFERVNHCYRRSKLFRENR